LIPQADFILIGGIKYDKEAGIIEADVYAADYDIQNNIVTEHDLIGVLIVNDETELYVPTMANRNIMVDATLQYFSDFFASYIIFGNKLPFYSMYDADTGIISYLEMCYRK